MGKKFGILDSGVGGLTVLKSLVDNSITRDVIYFADTKYFPYGIKPVDFIQKRVEDIVQFFIEQKVDEVIIACNTASSNAYEYLKSRFSIPIYSIVHSAILGLSNFKGEKIGVLATRRTKESGVYPYLIKKEYGNIEVFVESCSEGPLLDVIEMGIIDGEIVEKELNKCLKPLLDKGIDGLILGCTHLPFVAPVIKRNYPNLTIIDPSEEILRLVTKDDNKSEYYNIIIYVSDKEKEFQEIVHNLLKVDWKVERKDLERSELSVIKGEIGK
ncbi:MAG: glutamate racemase [Dictyoglomus sp. NZ13-RE01]|nr:MAG: glutamate racemase [Dictyoglomus sp. NZ13-RE01]